MWIRTVQYLVLLIQPSWVLPQASAAEWERFGDSMYSFKLDTAREVDTTHVDASFQCQSVGGWLVSIESTAEQEFIQKKIREKVESQGQTFAREQWWTSGHWNKKDEKWTWHNGIEVQSSQKLPKEETTDESTTVENANYIAIVHDVGTWKISPLPANYRLRFICEKEAEPAFIMDRFNRPAEERILRAVLQDYDNDARGNRKAQATVTVSVQFVLLRIQDLEEKNMVLTTMGFIIAEWLDERLSWHPEHYDNVTSVVLKAERIWLPELAIVNGAEETIISNFEKQRAVIHYDGKVHWEPGGNFRTTCDVDIWYFPFDQQECSIVIGAWVYNSNKMNVTNISNKMTTDNFTVNGEWDLLDTSARWGEVGLPCCPDIKYSHVVFTLRLNRRSLFYLVNIVTPCVLLSLLSLAVFWVPTEEGEKVSSGISVFLAFTVFLLMLADNIPKTSLHVPIFVIYLSCTMTLIGISITWTVIILNIHYHVKDSPVPRWAERLLLRRKKHMCCPLENKNQSDTKFVFKPTFPPKETHPNGLLKRRPPGGPGAQTDFYLTHQTEIDPLPPPPPPAPETDTVVRIKGTNETYTAHASDDTCGLSSSLIGGEDGNQSLYVPETTDNAEDWRQLARKLDKIVFSIILTLMVFSAVFILLMPFYNQYTPSNNH